MPDSRSEKGFDLVGDPRSPESATSEPMTFSALVLSLSTSALYHLGVPLGGPLAEAFAGTEDADPRIDLAMGQQTIEMLELLREKTRGNLDTEETQLLAQAIHDLKMRYVEVKRSHSDARASGPSKHSS